MQTEMPKIQSQQRNQSLRRVLERCKSKESVDIIDVDVEKPVVVNVSAAETSNWGSRRSGTAQENGFRAASFPPTDYDVDDVIIIESINDEGGDTLRNDYPVSGESLDGESPNSSEKGTPPPELREHLRNYHDVRPSNRFCFSFPSNSWSTGSSTTEFDSESIISDCNDSDCEIIEDSSGNIRKEWEKAALKKKTSSKNDTKLNIDATDLDAYPKTNMSGKTSETGSDKAQLAEGQLKNVKAGLKEAFDQPSLCSGQPRLDTDLICNPVNHNEFDEYRFTTEEQAAKQRQVEIQAEEAQSLKRKKKAEASRLDVEKRQKQRLEEIRESQKKDEEIINMKERLRAEVRKDLKKLEMRYRDLASLLRALGIPVKGGLFPLPHEVNAAYKQALLRFHPDRAPRSDVHQQVKAEETFKLISRLKDKLL